MRATMRIRLKTVVLSLVVLLLLAVVGAISMVGWQVVLGVGHPVHCTSVSLEIHPSRGPGRLIRTVEIGAGPAYRMTRFPPGGG